MTTSGSADFSVSRSDIIKDALLEIGALSAGTDPTTAETTDVSRMLNMMVKHWQIYPELWPLTDVTHTLTPGTQSYTVGTGQDIDTTRPLRLKAARRRDTAGTEIPVEVISRDEYMGLPVKSTQAPAQVVYYDPQLANGVVYVWPTGSTGNTTLILTFQRPLQDFDAASDTPDFPQEWYLALVKNLAVKISRPFGMPVDPFLVQDAAVLLAELRAHDSETVSIMMQPGR